MDYRPLGPTGMSVSSLCLGAMMLGQWGEPDHDTAVGLVHRALDAGINVVDTADVYSRGESEVIVGKALKGRRDQVVLATKFHWQMGRDRLQKGNSRRWVVQEVESSLRRLDTDWIDLYQVHRPDPTTDVEETLSALTDLQSAGKIRAFGCSTFPAHQLVEAHWVSERRGLGRFVTEQPPYSLLGRGIERDVLPVTEQYGMGTLPWSPLAGGWLSGKYRKGDRSTSRAQRMPGIYAGDDPTADAKLEVVEQLAALAAEAGLTLIHLAIAFVRQHPGVTSPIIGPRTVEHLDSQLGAADVVLGADVLDRIDAIVPPGTDVAGGEGAYAGPALTEPWLRRRRTA
jgi:aryl-alcohol dehydrogenase-like predicted oxidoreductase